MSERLQAPPPRRVRSLGGWAASLLATALLGLSATTAPAADSIHVRTPVYFDPDDSSDDAVLSKPLRWDDEFPVPIYIFDGPFFDILDPFNNPQGILDEDIIAAATRSVMRWNDAGGDFEWVPAVFPSDFAPVPDPFNAYAVDVRADGFNLITFRDPEIVPGDGVNFIPTVFYFREDFDPGEDGSDPTVNIVQLSDTAVAIELDGSATIAAVIFPKPYKAGEIIDADIAMNSVTLGYNLYPEDPEDLQGIPIEDTLGTLDIEALLVEVTGRQAGIAPSHLFNATMSQFYILDGSELDEFKTNPFERRTLLLDDKIAWRKAYGDDDGGLSGNFYDGVIYDPFLGSVAPPDLPTQVVYAGQPRLDGNVDLDTVFSANSRFGITEFFAGPVQMKACALTGRDLLLNLLPSGGDNDDNPIFNGINDRPLAPGSDWSLPGLPSGVWYLLGAPKEFSYDADTNDADFEASFPIEFFGGVDELAPLPGDGNQSSEDDFINTVRSRFVQVTIDARVNEEGTAIDRTNGVFNYSFSDGPLLLNGGDRNFTVARLVYPDGTVQDFDNRALGFSGLGTILLSDEARDRLLTTFILSNRSSEQVGTLDVQWVIGANPALGISQEREIRATWTFTNTSDQPLQFGIAQLYDIAYGIFANPVSTVNGEILRNSVAFGGPGEPAIPNFVQWQSTPSAAIADATLFTNVPADPSITVPNRVLFIDADEAVVRHNNLWTLPTTGVIFGPGISRTTGYILRYNPSLVPPGGSRSITSSFTAKLNEDASSLLGRLLARVENGYPRSTPAEIFADDPTRAFPIPRLGSSVPNINFITNTGTRNVLNSVDADGDGIPDDSDNCPFTPNADQADDDLDGIGDVCEGDLDNDGIPDPQDNCPSVPNPAQTDTDGDGIGDACDNDSDNDGIPDVFDNCVFTPNPGQEDQDGDGIGDVCEGDRDGDGIPDETDNCPFVPNPDQLDDDQDGIGNVCDPDRDGDGIPNTTDNCPDRFNPGQSDADGDGIGDACEDGSFFLSDVSPATTPVSSAQVPQSDFLSSGAAAGDLNGDGYVDLVIANAGTGGQTSAGLVNRIYINQGSSGRPGFFQDLTFGIDGIINSADDRLGFRVAPEDPPALVQDVTHSVILFDFDLDGDLDIYFCNRGTVTGSTQGFSSSRLLINVDVDDPALNPNPDADKLGDGFFRDVTRFANPGVLNFGTPPGLPPGLSGPASDWAGFNGQYLETRSKAADIDADGDLDLILASTTIFSDAGAFNSLIGFPMPSDLTPERGTGTPTEPFDTELNGAVNNTPYFYPAFSERVVINRRNELVNSEGVLLPIGTADAFVTLQDTDPTAYATLFPTGVSADDPLAARSLDAFWMRDETLGRDGFFGGSNLHQDRMPPIMPDVSPTQNIGEIDFAFTNTREVVVSPLNPFLMDAHRILGGTRAGHFPDIFVANGPAGGGNTSSASLILSNLDFRHNEQTLAGVVKTGEPTAYQFDSDGPRRDNPTLDPDYERPVPDFIPDGVFYSMTGGVGPLDSVPGFLYADETDLDAAQFTDTAQYVLASDNGVSSTLLLTIPDGKSGDFEVENGPKYDYDDFPTVNISTTGAVAGDFRASGGGTVITVSPDGGIVVYEHFRFNNTTLGRGTSADVSRGQDGFFLGGSEPSFMLGGLLQITGTTTEPAFLNRNIGSGMPEGRARAITAADFNRDGGLDFAYISDAPEGTGEGVLSSLGGVLSVFSNTDQMGGLASFQSVTTSAVDNRVRLNGPHLVAFDADNDADIDVFAPVSTGQARLWKNSLYSTDLKPNAFDVRDGPLFYDGTAETIARGYGSNLGLPIYGGSTTGVAAVDIDLDGLLDLAVIGGSEFTDLGSNSFVMHNGGRDRLPGEKQFTPAATGYPAPRLRQPLGIRNLRAAFLGSSGPHSSVVAQDIDYDGDYDLIVSQYGLPTLAFMNVSDKDTLTPPVDPYDINSLYKYNNEERRIVAASSSAEGFPSDLVSGTFLGVGSFVNVTDTWFSGLDSAAEETRFTRRVVVGDIDDDGDLDIFRANGVSDFGAPNTLWRNNRNFGSPALTTFTDVTAANLPQIDVNGSPMFPLDDTQDAAFADVDNDGDLDLIVCNAKAVFSASSSLVERVLLYFNDGTGHYTLADSTRMPTTTGAFEKVIVGDFGRRGDLAEDLNADKIVTDTEIQNFNNMVAAIQAERQAAGLTVPQVRELPTSRRVTEVLAIKDQPGKRRVTARPQRYLDMDNNGAFFRFCDIVLVGLNGQNVYLQNNGSGTFTNVSSSVFPSTFTVATAPGNFDVKAADINQDGWLDLVVASARGIVPGSPFQDTDQPSLTLLINEKRTSGLALFSDRTTAEIPEPRSALAREGFIDSQGNVRAVEVFDADGDGDMDIYVGQVGGSFGLDTFGALDYVYINRLKGENLNAPITRTKRTVGTGSSITFSPNLTAGVVNPSLVRQDSTRTVRVYGRNIKGGAQATFGPGISVVSPPIVRSSTELEVTIQVAPNASIGNRIVTIFNPDGQIATTPLTAFGVLPRGTATSVEDWFILE